MMHRLGLDIASDLRLSIGQETVQVTPRVGLALAESLLRVSVREMAREERERAEQRPRSASRNRRNAA